MGRTCTICRHPECDKIDEALVSGEPFRSVADRFGISLSALKRHKLNGHISAKIARAARRKERRAEDRIHTIVVDQKAREVLSVDRLLEVTDDLLAESLHSIREARDSADGPLKLKAIREARETSKLLLDVQGKLPPDTVVNVTLIENQWIEFRAALLNTLCPACRDAVVARLEERKHARRHD